MKTTKKLILSKRTVKELAARPLSPAQLEGVAGGGESLLATTCVPSRWDKCGEVG